MPVYKSRIRNENNEEEEEDEYDGTILSEKTKKEKKILLKKPKVTKKRTVKRKKGGQLRTGGRIKASSVLDHVGNVATIATPLAPEFGIPIGVSAKLGSYVLKKFGAGLYDAKNGLLNPSVVDNLKPHELSTIVASMNPHEFDVLQGIAAMHSNSSHHLGGAITNHISSFQNLPYDHAKSAMRDISKFFYSPHHLAREILDEHIQHKGNMGGGLFDSVKHIFKNSYHKAKNVARKGYHIARTVNHALQKGLKILDEVGNIAGEYDPEIGAQIKGYSDMGKSFTGTIDKGLDIGNKVGTVIDNIVSEE